MTAAEHPKLRRIFARFAGHLFAMMGNLKAIPLVCLVLFLPAAGLWLQLREIPRSERSVSDHLQKFGSTARSGMRGDFRKASVPYPPSRLILLGLKGERRIDIYAAGSDGPTQFVRSHRILAVADDPGPRLRADEHRVPEGIYEIGGLNPNSAAYVSLRIAYPNAFDRARAEENRQRLLDRDIVIHGPMPVAAGSIALSARSVEALFTLVADTGIEATRIIIAPYDLRRHRPPGSLLEDRWNDALYARLTAALAQLPPQPDN